MYFVKCWRFNPGGDALPSWTVRAIGVDKYKSTASFGELELTIDKKEGRWCFNGHVSTINTRKELDNGLFGGEATYYANGTNYSVSPIFENARVGDAIYQYVYKYDKPRARRFGDLLYAGERGAYPYFKGNEGDDCSLQVIDEMWTYRRGADTVTSPVQPGVLHRTPPAITSKFVLMMKREYYDRLMFQSLHWTPERTRWHPYIRLGALNFILANHRATMTKKLPFMHADGTEMMLRQMTLQQLYDIGRH